MWSSWDRHPCIVPVNTPVSPNPSAQACRSSAVGTRRYTRLLAPAMRGACAEDHSLTLLEVKLQEVLCRPNPGLWRSAIFHDVAQTHDPHAPLSLKDPTPRPFGPSGLRFAHCALKISRNLSRNVWGEKAIGHSLIPGSKCAKSSYFYPSPGQLCQKNLPRHRYMIL